MSYERLLTLTVVGLVLLGAAGLAAAHDTKTIEGYEMTFGGSDEPVVTGERMWLELNVVDAETDEPVTGLEDDLEIAVQRPFGNDTVELDVGSRFGEPGWYEAAILFTEPGTYTVYVEGSINGTSIDTTFSKQVHDVTNLAYPEDAQSSILGGLGPAAGFGLGVVTTAVAVAGAFVVGRRGSDGGL